MIAGSHISYDFIVDKNISYEMLHEMVTKKFYPQLSKNKELSTKIDNNIRRLMKESGITDGSFLSPEEAEKIFENYNIRERQGKFICNSLRVYEFFGYEWLIPLWDNGLFEFWSHIPLKQRYNRNLYFECCEKIPVPSTNERTTYGTMSGTIRKIPVLSEVFRKLQRLYNYFNSSFHFESIVGFPEYFMFVLLSRGYYHTNSLVKKSYMDLVFKENKTNRYGVNK